MPRRHPIQAWAFAVVIACSGTPPERPEQLADAETLTICAAASWPVGLRVRIEGTFDGFGYEARSLQVTLESDELCNERGAGLVFANLWGEAEGQKLASTRPGTLVVVEGEIEAVEEGRFVRLSDVLVVGNK